jgi:hypothetical protein
MRRHTKGNNVVFLTVFLKFVQVVALMAVEDQQAITTYSSGPSMLLKMPNLIHTFLICCLTVIGNSNYPIGWESTVLVPKREMVFPYNNNKWQHHLALGIDALGYCNPFTIARLYLFCLCTPV